MIEILILSKDRPLQLKDMIDSIDRVTPEYKIIICDNASAQPEMIELLKNLETKHTVIYNKENLVFEGLNPGLDLIKGDYFVMSDPDIILNPNMPNNWTEVMIDIMKRIRAPKVGVALNIDYPNNNMLTWRIRGCEEIHWRNQTVLPEVGEPCYYAAIDTTFAMQSRTTYTHWKDKMFFKKNGGGLYNSGIVQQFYKNQQCPIRIAGKYLAEHGGWYINPKYYSDYKWYKKTCLHGISSSIMHSREFIETVNDGRESEEMEKIRKTLPDGYGPAHPKWNVPSYRNKYEIMMGVMGK